MATTTPRARGRVQASSNVSLWSWFFMRISGLVLLFMAVFHLLWMHFVVGLDNITMRTIIDRWDNPLWRIYDMFLLWFALLHGFNGARWVTDDWVTNGGLRIAIKSLIYILAFALLVLGSWIILAFPVGGPPGAR
jgi:succinate dehydrogenase / fumarate reductase, membrane anchor subunit